MTMYILKRVHLRYNSKNSCINTSVTHYYYFSVLMEKSCVLIRDVQGINAWLLLMLVTMHHAKHLLNYEYLTSARIMHIFESVLA